MNKVVGIVFITALLSGCSSLGVTTTEKALSVLASSANIKYYYEDGDIVEFIDNAVLTDQEADIVLEALYQIDEAKAKLKAYENKPFLVISEINYIAYEYTRIKSAYLSLREIVLAHKDEYSFYEWDTFTRFDGAAKLLDTQFEELVKSTQTSAALLTAIRLADTTIKVAALL